MDALTSLHQMLKALMTLRSEVVLLVSISIGPME